MLRKLVYVWQTFILIYLCDWAGLGSNKISIVPKSFYFYLDFFCIRREDNLTVLCLWHSHRSQWLYERWWYGVGLPWSGYWGEGVAVERRPPFIHRTTFLNLRMVLFLGWIMLLESLPLLLQFGFEKGSYMARASTFLDYCFSQWL